jgi:hypothetical protein
MRSRSPKMRLAHEQTDPRDDGHTVLIRRGEHVRNGTVAFPWTCYSGGMSARNGDRARFHKERKRKLHHRQRIRALMARLRKRVDASTRIASLNMNDEGGPARIGD